MSFGKKFAFDISEKIKSSRIENLPDNFCDTNYSWDWYQATMDPKYQVYDLVRWLESGLGYGEGGVPDRGLHGYEHSLVYSFARLMWGGCNAEYGAHLQITGGFDCHRFTSCLRADYPEHRVSRCDVCVDFLESKGFDAAVQMAGWICKKNNIQTRLAGDWLEAKKGRTLYAGCLQSSHQMRLYEKGKEQIDKRIDLDANPDWFRLEFQIRPEKQRKAVAASLSPDEMPRTSKWTAAMSQAFGLSFGRGVKLTNNEKKKSKEIQTLEHMLHQYASTLQKVVENQHMTEAQLLEEFRRVIRSGVFDGLEDRK